MPRRIAAGRGRGAHQLIVVGHTEREVVPLPHFSIIFSWKIIVRISAIESGERVLALLHGCPVRCKWQEEQLRVIFSSVHRPPITLLIRSEYPISYSYEASLPPLSTLPPDSSRPWTFPAFSQRPPQEVVFFPQLGLLQYPTRPGAKFVPKKLRRKNAFFFVVFWCVSVPKLHRTRGIATILLNFPVNTCRSGLPS